MIDKHSKKYFLALVIIFCFNTTTNSADKPLDLNKQTSLGLYLSAVEANKMLSKDKNIIFIDVRTRAEVAFLGMASAVDANIPYMTVGDWDEWDDEKHNFKLFPNSNFLPYFNDYITENNFNKNSITILICRSGNRSAGAANLLAQVGYKKIYSIVDGFEGEKRNNEKNHQLLGWKESNLPWSKNLTQEKMYMEF